MIFLSILFIIIEYSLACLFVGVLFFWILSKKDKKSSKTLTNLELISAYLLGQGILANIWVLLALQGWFLPVIIKTTIATLAVCSLLFSYKNIFSFFERIIKILTEAYEYTIGWKLVVVLSILICVAWVTSIGRSPLGDGSGFYLAIAKVIAESHHLAPLPGYEKFTSIGLQGEMHFSALMVLGSPAAAQLFSWPTMLAGSLVLLGISQKVGTTRRGQWLVFAMVFTSSAVIELSGNGKTDLFAAALGLSAYYWAMKIHDTEGYIAIWLTSIFAGLALVAKISYIPTLLPSIAIIAAQAFWLKHDQHNFKIKELIPYLVIGIFGLFFAIFPHLIKNYMLFENPLAPFGISENGLQDQVWYGPETIKRILLTIPFALTFGDYWAQIGNITPLIIAFFPFILLLPRQKNFWASQNTILTLAALFGLLCWFVFRPSILAPRYFMACLLLLCVPAAKAVDFFITRESNSSYPQIIIITVINLTILTSATYFLNRVFFPAQTFSYLSGQLSECEKEPRYCGSITRINQSANEGERLFSNNDIRYWLRSDLIQCALSTEETKAYLTLETPEQRWSFIYGRGFKVIPIINNWSPLDNKLREDLEHTPEWLAITQVKDQYITILTLSSDDSAHASGVGCHQTEHGWELFNLSSDS